jgi:hypothetical protein
MKPIPLLIPWKINKNVVAIPCGRPNLRNLLEPVQDLALGISFNLLKHGK